MNARKHYFCISLWPSVLQKVGRHLHHMKLVYSCAPLLNNQHRRKKKQKTTAAEPDNVLKASPHQLYRFLQLPSILGNEILPLVLISLTTNVYIDFKHISRVHLLLLYCHLTFTDVTTARLWIYLRLGQTVGIFLHHFRAPSLAGLLVLSPELQLLRSPLTLSPKVHLIIALWPL